MQTLYGKCRPNGQRRVTTTCTGNAGYVCPSSGQAQLSQCAYGCVCENTRNCRCATEEEGKQDEIKNKPRCAYAPPTTTRLEKCRPDEGRWVGQEVYAAERCGPNCALCGILWTCTRDYCLPDTKPLARPFWRCDGPACVSNAEPTCDTIGFTTFHFANESESTLFIRVTYTVKDKSPLYSGTLLSPTSKWSYYITNPGATHTVNFQIALVGALDQPRFYVAEYVYITLPTFTVRSSPPNFTVVSKEVSYMCFGFVCSDLTKGCDEKDWPTLPSTDFSRKLLSVADPLDILHGAVVQFEEPSNLLLFKFMLDTPDGFVEQPGTEILTNPAHFRIFRDNLNPQFFQLLALPTRQLVTLRNAQGQASSRFKLALVREHNTLQEDKFQVRISFFTVLNTIGPADSSNFELLGSVRPLPMRATETNIGIDNAILTVLQFDAKVAEEWQRDNPEKYAVGCCMGNQNLAAICNATRLSPMHADCDDFMQEWCGHIANNTKPECSCYPKLNPDQDSFEDQITQLLESGPVPLARKCLVPSCKTNNAYVPTAMQRQECPSICAQIQSVINEGKLTKAILTGLQNMRCAGKFITIPSANANTPTANPNTPNTTTDLSTPNTPSAIASLSTPNTPNATENTENTERADRTENDEAQAHDNRGTNRYRNGNGNHHRRRRSKSGSGSLRASAIAVSVLVSLAILLFGVAIIVYLQLSQQA